MGMTLTELCQRMGPEEFDLWHVFHASRKEDADNEAVGTELSQSVRAMHDQMRRANRR